MLLLSYLASCIHGPVGLCRRVHSTADHGDTPNTALVPFSSHCDLRRLILIGRVRLATPISAAMRLHPLLCVRPHWLRKRGRSAAVVDSGKTRDKVAVTTSPELHPTRFPKAAAAMKPIRPQGTPLRFTDHVCTAISPKTSRCSR